MPAQPDVEAVTRAYFAALRGGAREAWLDNFAPDATLADPVDAPPVRGREGLAGFWRQMTKLFARVELIEGDLFVAGRRAAATWTGRNTTHDGKVALFAGITTFEVDDAGKLRAVQGFWDARAMLRQLR